MGILDTGHFKRGFLKTAKATESFWDKAKSYAPIGLGVAAGLGTYGLLRHGKLPAGRGLSDIRRSARKHGLTRTIYERTPKSKLKHELNKILYGADEVGYIADNLPKKPKQTGGVVIHDNYSFSPVIGKHNFGKTPYEIGKREDIDIAQSLGRGSVSKHINPGAKYKGERGLKRLHKKLGDKNYFIKPEEGAASGVGGESFINRSDIRKYLAGKPLKKQKLKKINDFKNDPQKHTVSSDVGILKDPITGSNREFRVHAFGKHVVPGASSVRGWNETDVLMGTASKAEKWLQQKLKNLPKKYRDIAIAADVAKTKKGFKIIELNAGANNSGFLDPKTMIKDKGLSGLIAAAHAVKANQDVYKHMTGRASKLEAGVKGIGAAGLAASAPTVGEILHKKYDEKIKK